MLCQMGSKALSWLTRLPLCKSWCHCLCVCIAVYVRGTQWMTSCSMNTAWWYRPKLGIRRRLFTRRACCTWTNCREVTDARDLAVSAQRHFTESTATMPVHLPTALKCSPHMTWISLVSFCPHRPVGLCRFLALLELFAFANHMLSVFEQ